MPLKITRALKVFVLGSLIILASKKSFAQSDTTLDIKWATILKQYESGKLTDSTYLDEAQLLVDLSIKDITLKEKLATYKKIAWSDPKFQKRRLRYYLMLYNNTLYTYRAGASLYYMEKAEEERKKIKPYTQTLLGSVAIFFNYGRTKSGYARCIEEYNRILPFLEDLPKRIARDSVPVMTITNAMAVLTDIIDFYIQLSDTASALKACTVSENIRNSSKQKKQYPDAVLHRPYYSYYLAQHSKQKILHQYEMARKMLDTAFTIINDNHTNDNYTWWNAATSDMYLNYFEFFIDQKKSDSAARYLGLIKSRQDSAVANLGDGTAYLYNYGQLKASEGDYKTAYENILSAYEINDSVIGVKTADITNNLYAQTLAEDTSEALQKAEDQKRRRNRTIGIISTLSLLFILLLYVRMRIKDKAARDRIYKLRFASQLQIIELEEKNLAIKQEEQRKLGMDLHDDLAGTIAAARVKIESEIKNNADNNQVDRLKSISNLIGDIYQSTRNKSHNLYHGQGNDPEVSFSKRIKLITDNSFASDKYNINIQVDDDFMKLKEVGLPIKIQFLYIIQEAVTNIIKHAAADTISILIYEDISGLVLEIKDNGKGFKQANNKKGIGLNSIQERAESLNGTATIHSGNKGTEITVTVPVLLEKSKTVQ